MKIPDSVINAVRLRAQQPQGRSFYIYDMAVMRDKIARLKKILPDSVQIFYAMKANPHAAFLQTALSCKAEGIEIASMGEGKKALAAGFAADRIIFTGPGKSPEELEWSVDERIRTVHIESLVEAHRLNAICARQNVTQDILVRVNPNFHIHDAQANFSGDSNKLGIDEGKLYEQLPIILGLKHLKFRGLHVYAASGVLRVADLLKNCELVFAMVREVEARFKQTRCGIIDFGGGFGIDYLETGNDFSPDDYAAGLKTLIAQAGFGERQFVLELGRYLTADSGWYCTEILDIKDSLGKKQMICAGGSHQFRRPAALKINHPMAIIAMNRPAVFAGQGRVRNEHVFIGGPLCNTADKLATYDVAVASADIGDFAVFGYAGAYGLTMSHVDFLSHARPDEIVL